jgi:hypothetical protein
MDRSIYLINPREGAPGYFNMEVLGAWGVGNYVNLADLTTTTVAAMVDGWRVSLCDDASARRSRDRCGGRRIP